MNEFSEEEELPPPERDTIRNAREYPGTERRGTELLFKPERYESALPLLLLSDILKHFERLFLIIQNAKSGRKLERSQHIAGVPGGQQLFAATPQEGSYLLPLLFGTAENALVVQDSGEFSVVLDLLSETDVANLSDQIGLLSEKAGDELVDILVALADHQTDLEVRNTVGGSQRVVKIEARGARARVEELTAEVTAVEGRLSLAGHLYRIDTKSDTLMLDVGKKVDFEDGLQGAIRVEFDSDEFLEDLKQVLGENVSMEVEATAGRRSYDVTSRTTMHKLAAIL